MPPREGPGHARLASLIGHTPLHDRRVSVRVRLLASFGIVVALMLAVGLFAVTRLGSDNQQLNRLAAKVVPSTQAVGDINALMNKYRKDQLHYILAKPADRPISAPGSVAGDLSADLSQISTLIDSYRSRGLVDDATDARLLQHFETDFSRYVELTASFATLADQMLPDQASAVVGDGPGDHQYDKLKVDIAAWSDHTVATASEAAAASRSSSSLGVLAILVLLATAVMIAATVAILLARKTTRAVQQIGAAAKAISEGDIDQRVTVRSRDEFGEMAQHFDSMVEYLRTTVAIAETIADGRLDIEVTPRSERDALGNSLAVMTDSLRRLVAENEHLLAASREEANTDALTGLPNRRSLMSDLESTIEDAGDERQFMLGVFDLDGFKLYNDMFGHAAGDALLVRLADRLRGAIHGEGTAYRMGGDEFCVLTEIDGNSEAAIARRSANALSEKGEAFTIGCSYGVANIPREAAAVGDAIRVADQRMYEYKNGRASASRQSADVLLRVLAERHPGLELHISEVAQLAILTAEEMGVDDHEVKRVGLAAELHDVGKAAIPDSILNKPGPLDDEEWEFMRRHTEIGERIVTAAPSIAHTADLLRSSHERWDGGGYPDCLAGPDIPLGARIISVCDSFDAMTSARPYSDSISVAAAVAEVRRCSGTQFDPDVVTAFCEIVENPEFTPRPAPPGELAVA
jgi:diguanylate cyclase (GGDEF)-like protein